MALIEPMYYDELNIIYLPNIFESNWNAMSEPSTNLDICYNSSYDDDVVQYASGEPRLRMPWLIKSHD